MGGPIEYKKCQEADFQAILSPKFGKKLFTTKWPKNQNFFSNFKNPHPNIFLYSTGPPITIKLGFRSKTGKLVRKKSQKMVIFKEKCWKILLKTHKAILAFWSIKFQPLRVGRQMSPFWKEETQGNMSHNQKKYFFDPGPPPCPLKQKL